MGGKLQSDREGVGLGSDAMSWMRAHGRMRRRLSLVATTCTAGLHVLFNLSTRTRSSPDMGNHAPYLDASRLVEPSCAAARGCGQRRGRGRSVGGGEGTMFWNQMDLRFVSVREGRREVHRALVIIMKVLQQHRIAQATPSVSAKRMRIIHCNAVCIL